MHDTASMNLKEPIFIHVVTPRNHGGTNLALLIGGLLMRYCRGICPTMPATEGFSPPSGATQEAIERILDGCPTGDDEQFLCESIFADPMVNFTVERHLRTGDNLDPVSGLDDLTTTAHHMPVKVIVDAPVNGGGLALSMALFQLLSKFLIQIKIVYHNRCEDPSGNLSQLLMQDLHAIIHEEIKIGSLTCLFGFQADYKNRVIEITRHTVPNTHIRKIIFNRNLIPALTA